MKELKNLLREKIESTLPPEPVALLFSGGTDSLTILWTLLDLGIQVTCYTFRLSYFESVDARVSAKVCQHYNVPQVLVTEDSQPTREQLQAVIQIIKSYRKTHVEVMYGYYFLMQAVKEQHVYAGLQADTLYGSNKNSAIRCGKQSASFFADYRRNLLKTDNTEGLAQARLMAQHFGKVLYTPYATVPIRNFFFQYSWQQINRPKQKMPAIYAFNDRFSELPIYRHDDNMQCGSRLREHLSSYVKEYRKIYEQVT